MSRTSLVPFLRVERNKSLNRSLKTLTLSLNQVIDHLLRLHRPFDVATAQRLASLLDKLEQRVVRVCKVHARYLSVCIVAKHLWEFVYLHLKNMHEILFKTLVFLHFTPVPLSPYDWWDSDHDGEVSGSDRVQIPDFVVDCCRLPKVEDGEAEDDTRKNAGQCDLKSLFVLRLQDVLEVTPILYINFSPLIALIFG